MTDSDMGLITKDNNPVPLTGVHVDGQITGRGARVKVKQLYINREDKPIEAIYKFPLPEQASVCGFRVIIGDKILEGEIEERDKAFELYDKALERGDGAYLLDEERPNIFTLSVGALPPKASATIEIEYITLLDATDNEVRFFLPTTISPRYVPEETPDERGIPVVSLVNPPIGLDVPYGLKIKLTIEGKECITGIESPSHTIATRYENNHVVAELSAEETRMDRDFVLTIRYKEASRNRVVVFREKEEVFFQVDLSPEKELRSLSEACSMRGCNEIIFVLDCSGSMRGSSIHGAKQALLILLKALRGGTNFNIYRFGTTYEKLFQTSAPCSNEGFQRAENYIKGITADLGGTEMLGPLADIYKNKAQEMRSVVLITDGEVGNEQSMFNLAKSETGTTRIFTIGIGHGPNEYLIKQLARISGGSSELVSPGERVEPKVLRLFGKITSATISDVKIHWPGQAIQAPRAPAVYAGGTISIFGKLTSLDKVPDTLKITASVGGVPREWVLDVTPSTDSSSVIPSLWARERIRDLEEEVPGTGSQQKDRKANAHRNEIINVSKRYSFMSRETSFVTVEKRLTKDRTDDEIILRKIPAMLTKDWGGRGAVYSRLSVENYRQFDVDALLIQPLRAFDSMEIIADPTPFEPSGQMSFRNMVSENSDDKLLYDILNAQRREGGFEVAPAVFHLAGLSHVAFGNIINKIRTAEPTDLPVLLATAITLHFLKIRFANRRREWEMVVEKSEEWLRQEIRFARPTTDGVPLAEWLLRNGENLEQASYASETILVVEDDDATREIIVGCLLDKNLGLSIETASNGVEALDRIAERAPSILITNMNMPKMNGIDLLKTLHERGISIPTLVTSGWWTQKAFEKELAERGVVPENMIVFLQKPFRFEELVVLVEKLRQGEPNDLMS